VSVTTKNYLGLFESMISMVDPRFATVSAGRSAQADCSKSGAAPATHYENNIKIVITSSTSRHYEGGFAV
jgi:hypothetical protein